MTPVLEQTSPYESLKAQILQKQEVKHAVQEPKTGELHVRKPSGNSQEMGQGSERERDANDPSENQRKGFRFSKGETSWDIDDDAELEFVADKKPMKMTLREMRDAAAGGVAVRNRMRQLAEEKRSLHDPYKDFSKNYKADPLNALKKVFGAVQKVDPDANFNEFISELGKQAQNLSQMEPSARKAHMLEKELEEANNKVTDAQRVNRLSELKQDLVEQTGLPDEKIFHFGQEILNNPVLAKTVKNEEDLIERIGDLALEVEMQKASHTALRKYKSDISPRDPLVFELSNLLKENPDFDDRDLEEIAHSVLGTVQKARASQKLSKKQNRSFVGSRSDSEPDFSRMSSFEALKYQIEMKKKQKIGK